MWRPPFRELYEGARLGRQELQGAMILDPVDAGCEMIG
jgi:phage terminase large subunit-like protein